MKSGMRRLLALFTAAATACCFAFIPPKRPTQYTHRVWTQAEGMPQDTVRAITQTRDGYLWAGTDEGLARFDGYRFVVFGRKAKELPSSGVTALCAGSDGTLWIATSSGLTSYREGVFRSYGVRDGLGANALISDVREGPDGSIWLATGLHLTRFRNGTFTNYGPAPGSNIQGVRAVLPEKDGNVWVAGYGSVGRLQGSQLVPVYGGGPLIGNIAMAIARERRGTLLLSGTEGLFELSPGKIVRHTSADGLPDTFVRSFLEDRDGNLWAGTNAGLARREHGRFTDLSRETLHPHEWVWCIFEDRDGSLWVGANSGLHQFLDQPIAVYTRGDGLPSDQPTAAAEDNAGRLWVGFHDSGVGYFQQDRFIPVPGLPMQEVFSVRSTRSGDLLIGTRGGLSRISGGRTRTEFAQDDSLARRNIFDAIEDSRGRVWVGSNQGALVLEHGKVVERPVLGGTLLTDAVVALLETRDGSVWAGSYGHGLWRIHGQERRQFTTADGLPTDQIRSLYEDRNGILWVGTFNGGAAYFRGGRFTPMGVGRGLPSDNVARIFEDSAGSLWLSTARGLAELSKSDVADFVSGRISVVRPRAYGVADGLRSAQCAPGYPTGTGGIAGSDGRLWFPTGYGLAVFDPGRRPVRRSPPATHVLEVLVDGTPAELTRPLQLSPDTRRVEFRYAAVELSAPETLRYRFRLSGIDPDWVSAENRRLAEYSKLPYGSYTFAVQATLGSGSAFGEPAALTFVRLPHAWETAWFRWALVLLTAALIWAVYQWRLREVERRFALVLDERARIAREIHDTLAQGFVGISSQLDAVAMMLPLQPEDAARHLQLARRMSQHSLTEARRSIVDLRAESLETSDFGSAIRAAARFITAGTQVRTEVEVEPAVTAPARGVEQQLLRIAQEAISNAVKHAAASRVRVDLRCFGKVLRLTIRDDGRGFDTSQAFISTGGHFGLLGMRERAERIHGEFRLESAPGAGTTIEVTVPVS